MATPATGNNKLTLDGLGTIVLRQGDKDASSLWGGNVQVGITGNPVAELQAALIAVGTLDGKPDGQFGLRTMQALQRFQWYMVNMQFRLKVPAGSQPGSGGIAAFSGRMIGSPGVCNAATATELISWQTGSFVTTTPLVRLGIGQISNVKTADEFTLLDYPGATKGEVLVHADFASVLSTTLSDQATRANVKLLINQTFRRDDVAPTGAVVTPAKKSQHLVGHAVDLNIQDGNTVNSSAMFKAGTETTAADSFVAGVKSVRGIRWGGDFSPKDYVHFDDFLNPDGEAYQMTFFFVQNSFHANHPMRLVS